MGGTAPIAVALDARDLDTASAWARAVEPHVSTLKVGLELFCRFGPEAVASVRGGSRIDLFLDLKLNDIPNTVAGAVRSMARLRPTYLTVHALGGSAMIEAAAAELPEGLITAVTVLTSLDDSDLTAFGFAGSSQDAVRRLAVMSVAAGAQAIVCSAREVAAVRAEVGPTIVLITPGVRSAGADHARPSPRRDSRTGTCRWRRPPRDRAADHRRGRPGCGRGIACRRRCDGSTKATA